MDWRNVSAGSDSDGAWAVYGQSIVRQGWAWVGSSVQVVGVHGFPPPHPLAGQGLKQWSPARYGPLDVTNNGAVTDDSQSYDIYTQIAQLLKHPGRVDPFDGMRAQRVYAAGGSQSAQFLVRYYNYLQPQTNAFDGFLATQGGPAPRPNQRTKILKLYTETDVARQAPLRVVNSSTTHTWEIAGAPHMPSIWQSADKNDFRGNAAVFRDLGVDFPPAKCTKPWPSPVESWIDGSQPEHRRRRRRRSRLPESQASPCTRSFATSVGSPAAAFACRPWPCQPRSWRATINRRVPTPSTASACSSAHARHSIRRRLRHCIQTAPPIRATCGASSMIWSPNKSC
jgi:hypothetical protein